MIYLYKQIILLGDLSFAEHPLLSIKNILKISTSRLRNIVFIRYLSRLILSICKISAGTIENVFYTMKPNLFVCLWLAIALLFSSCDIEKSTSPPQSVIEIDTIPIPIISPVIIDYDTSLWANIKFLDPSIHTNNFVKEVIYDCAGCYLRPEVAKALVLVHQDLKEMGYGGIKVFDCYRPRLYQQRLWDKVPDHRFVSDPKKGSNHTRGMAVDLTIIDTYGKKLNMGTNFDHFGKESYHEYSKFEDSIIGKNRKLLISAMKKRGFKHIRTEWWHYSYTLKQYKLSDWVWNCDDVMNK
jgi:D-alanyl-D-alanine dipeptidase